ncbi:MtrAB system histidine kinase MtrB [Leucobacter sp. Ag1]|uniref:MtrAB system histidine kinase MtrB n=1 Tax=Leucobacter sp. Ag1 TaxID=1642040 RepID=UPI00069C58A4|nr:MtrAB system histidine kinase MtrB [Leucobacter sp. Ag1]
MAGGRTALGRRLRRARIRWIRASQPVLGPFRARWRRSLRLRTMTYTGLITGVMILISGTYILASIGDDLYSSRRDQVLQDAARATLAAQSQLDGSDAADRSALSSLANSVRATVGDTTSSQMIYVRRQPHQTPLADAPLDSNTSPDLVNAITAELSDAVMSRNQPQYWQAVTLHSASGEPVPGIVVASTLTFPSGTGTYDLFIGYSLADTQRTLGFIQRTLVLTALILMLLIGALVWIIARIVFRPIRAAADVSRRLAAGESRARMPLQNDEHFDELSANFNDMADTLQARIDELDQVSEMQQRFVSDVSHELRTPLTTIRLASEVLQAPTAVPDGPELTGSQQRALEVLGNQVERFEQLLGDLLEISRYDAGRITIETEPTNLVSLTREVVDGLQSLSHGLIEVRAIGGYSPIEVDPRRIRRIVSNLVGNAIEHGERKAIVVTIDSNAAAVAISVRDWGIGMNTEDVAHAFDRFWRADPSRKRTLGGTGRGLAIAREDAAVHGGLLEAWSRPGEGSNFRLTLPRREGTASFVSPIPLVPDDVVPDAGDPQATGGWLRRPKRRVKKEGR